ncbi:MAG TPA: hypothetical protein PKA81_10245 [Clostridia bacterium]|nr:hypothetical protein [Clostridia bacterium]
MKRFFACMLLLFVAFSLAACADGLVAAPAQSRAPDSVATPAPTPVPDHPRVIAVFGAEDAPAFLSGVERAAKDSGVEIRLINGGLSALADYKPEGDAVALVYLSGTATLPKASIPMFVFAAEGQPLASDLPQLRYDAASAPKRALENALNYPPHLAPVRLIGLFSSQASPAYLLWSEAKTAGSVFAKEEFFADTSEVAITQWLADVLSGYYPGMLDALYAETGAFAVAAADALAGLGRDDLEVFSAGTDADVADKLSPILICAVGINQADAGTRCFTEAQKLLSGESAQSGTLPPDSLWYAASP